MHTQASVGKEERATLPDGWAVLAGLATPLFVVDGEGRILTQTRGAVRVLGDGLADAAGRLIATDAMTGARLRRLVAAAARGEGGLEAERALQVPRPSRRPPYVVRVAPLAGAALCAVVDRADRPTPRAEELASLFDLTPAEARVAIEIARGDVPKVVAARLGTSYATVRTQLQRVYDKTGAASQADLVALLLQLGLAI